ncbi:MFS transporter [Budviciaceae bacterium BWR-B9]|uniref:MFS transporter n=1 Tax=Limnobaculum allomyrinae TaxID=2791986 RepID=A0ABS1IPG2_9GAMM|nr:MULTISPECIES: MFS transporter [Limnobaculum]MBK5143539.1 MFS transporter [Limnobaculum allomyrinae]MBV7691427.1 MFS transporter [Limnobaculum sp. M2-1]
MTNAQKWKVFFLLFTTMFLLGGIQNTKGIILEQVHHDIGLTMSQIGTLISTFQYGFLIASLLTGYFTDKKGLRFMMFIGASCMAIGLVGTSMAFTVMLFLGFYLVIGLGIGSMLVSIVTVIPTFYKERAGMMFNVANAMFGVGMIVTPLVLNMMFSHNISWRIFYIAVAVIVALILLVLTTLRLEKSGGMDMNVKDFMQLLTNGRLMLVIAYLLFYVAAEVAFLNFFPIFYSSLDIANATVAEKTATGAYVIASFAVLFTIGRFIGGFINMRLGERNTLILFSALSLITLIISRMMVYEWIYAFMAFGFAMSVLFPTASAIGTRMTDKNGSMLGLIYVASGLGGAFAGWLVGMLSDTYGIAFGFNTLIGFVCVFLVLSWFVREVPDTAK